MQAAEQRQRVAHGASRGWKRLEDQVPSGRKNPVKPLPLSPRWGWIIRATQPTAHAVGYWLSRLRR